MPEIFSPEGVSHWVPTQSTADDWVRNRGFRHTPPPGMYDSLPAQTAAAKTININTCTLEEMVELTGVKSIAKLKKIVELRPYSSLEELAIADASINWQAAKLGITF